MAPEILNEDKVTFAADIFSLGITLVHLANGELPFVGYGLQRLCTAIATFSGVYQVRNCYSKKL